MDKHEYFLKALLAGACKKREWVNGVFSVTVAVEDTTHLPDYPYRLKRVEGDNRHYFVDPDTNDILPIEGTTLEEPLYVFTGEFALHPGDLPNYTKEDNTEPLRTTYGRALVNMLCLCIPFGTEIPYVNEHFRVREIEKIIESKLIDDPEDDTDAPAPTGKIYVRQYLQFVDHMLSLVGYNSLCVVSATPKSLVSHPKARARRKELVEQYEGQLSDPSIVARISKELQALDKEWLRDDPSAPYYWNAENKLFGASRSKMFYMFGGESPFSDGTSVEFIEKSLEEGIDTNNMPAMINSLRYGSYNRGKQTQLGGEATKTIYRMMGSVRIAEEECGTKLGVPMEIYDNTKHHFLELNILEGGKTVLLTNDNINSYVGQTVSLRSPLTCKTDGRNVCSMCIGPKLAEQPNGLAAASAGVSGRFLSLFLKLMHGSALVTERWDLSERLT